MNGRDVTFSDQRSSAAKMKPALMSTLSGRSFVVSMEPRRRFNIGWGCVNHHWFKTVIEIGLLDRSVFDDWQGGGTQGRSCFASCLRRAAKGRCARRL